MKENNATKKRLMKYDGHNNTVLMESDFRELTRLYQTCVGRFHSLHSNYLSAPTPFNNTALRPSKSDRSEITNLAKGCDVAIAKYEEFCQSFVEDGDGIYGYFPNPIEDPRVEPLRYERVRDTEWLRMHQQLKKSLTNWQVLIYLLISIVFAYLVDAPWSMIGFSVALLWLYLAPNYSDTLQLLRQRGREVCPFNFDSRNLTPEDFAPLINYGIKYSDIGTPWEGYLKTRCVTVEEEDLGAAKDHMAFAADQIRKWIPRVYNDDLSAVLIVGKYIEKVAAWNFQGHLFYRASHVEDHMHSQWTMENKSYRYGRKGLVCYEYDYKDVHKYDLSMA